MFYEDTARHRAYALRSALLEPGTAPYLGGLRLAQAKNCREFLDAAMYWKAPTENLICGDVDGNIAWQASALTPNRTAPRAMHAPLVDGRLPVPGTGAYEWDGFRTDLPREFNPPRGFIATANNNIHPPGFTPPMMFKTSTNVPFERITRLLQMITAGSEVHARRSPAHAARRGVAARGVGGAAVPRLDVGESGRRAGARG